MTPKKITDQLELTLGQLGHARQLRDAIEDILLEHFDQPATKAAELSERLCDKVAEEIETRVAAALESGTIAVVSLRPNRTVVHGSSFVFPDDGPSTILTKLSRLHSQRLLLAIQSLDFREFEKFGGAVLRELGCPLPVVTKHSTDQGIDFYGEMSIGGTRGERADVKRLMHSAKMMIIGQAKHYPNRNIGPREVRELVGALSLARTSTFSRPGLDLLDQIELRPNTPALAVLFSTGDFTMGARYLASAAGLVLYSGSQLAVFLADCQVGIRGSGSGSEFDDKIFRAWMYGQGER